MTSAVAAATASNAPESALAARARAAEGLAACEQLLGQHLGAAVQRFGSAAIGLVDLPPLGPGRVVGAQLRVAAVLYWCREVEEAGLPAFVEELAERLARGELTLDLGSAAPRLAAMWRQRAHRFSAPERRALYARVFGGPLERADGAFPGRLHDLAATAAEIGRRRADQGVADLHARLAVLAGELGQDLSDKATGMAGFAAREIVAQVREALSLLADPGLSRALGGGAPWSLVARWAPSVLGRPVDVARHVDRATSGLTLLRFVADAAGNPDAGARGVGRTHPLVDVAERWLASDGGAA